MASVVSRSFRSNPYRSAEQTWVAITDLLTGVESSAARTELLSVSNIASSIIADQSPKENPITVVCKGPRIRIYCHYDDSAIEGGEEKENALGFSPLNSEWSISLPCNAEDLTWIQNALSKLTTRITARDLSSKPTEKEEVKSDKNKALVIDQKGFLGI